MAWNEFEMGVELVRRVIGPAGLAVIVAVLVAWAISEAYFGKR